MADGAENGAAGVGFVNPLERLTGGAEGFDLSQSWTAIQDRAMTAMSEVDDLRRQGLQKAREQASSVREKASNVEFFNLDGLQEKDPYMVTAAAPAAAPAAAAPANGDDGGELARVKEAALRDARRTEAAGLAEATKLRALLAETQRELAAARGAATAADARAADADGARSEAARSAANAREEAAGLRAAAGAAHEALAAADARASAAEGAADAAGRDADSLRDELAALRGAQAALAGGASEADAFAAASRLQAEQARKDALAAAGRAGAARGEAAAVAAELAREKFAREALDREVEELRRRLRRSTAAPPPPPPPAAAPVESPEDDYDAMARSLVAAEELRAALDRAAAAHHDISELRRGQSILEARAGKLAAERDLFEGRCVALERDRGDAAARLDAADRAATAAVAAREAAYIDVDDRVAAAEARGAATARAAKRQVVSLDHALEGAMAHGAYYAATRDAEMRAHRATIDALEAKLAEAEAHLDEARGRRAFYFSGEVRDELARLERANDALKGGGDVVEAPDNDATAPAPAPSPRARAAPAGDGAAGYDAATRAAYVAMAVTQLCHASRDGGDSRASSVAPALKEMIREAYNPVHRWLAVLERDDDAARATCAALAVCTEALDEAARAAAARAAATDGEVDAAAAAAAAAAASGAAAAREAEDGRRDARATCELLEQRADHREALGALSTRLADALAERDALRDAVAGLRRDAAYASPEFAHARASLLALLDGGKGGEVYNTLLPVLRTLMKEPHAVVQANVDALLATGSGAAFVAALTCPPGK